jgi:hypothetical protein
MGADQCHEKKINPYLSRNEFAPLSPFGGNERGTPKNKKTWNNSKTTPKKYFAKRIAKTNFRLLT